MGRRQARIAAAALAVGGALVALPGPAAAAQAPLERARAALAPAPGAVARGVSPTVALRDLAVAIPELSGAERRSAKAILARPTEGADVLGNDYSVAEEEPHCTSHFCVHYVATTDDAPPLDDEAGLAGVPDYVELVAGVAERSLLVETGELGWPGPVSDGALGGIAERTDIYLANVGGQGLFGYAAPDPPPAQRCTRSCFAYLVLDDDYAPTEYDYDDPAIPLSATAAHELNHVLQFGIDAIQDGWLLESTAVWAEERVFPDANDWLHYIPAFAGTPGTPITDFDGAGGLRVYGAAVWNHWLSAGRYGSRFPVDVWRGSTLTRPRDFAVGAYDRAIRSAGRRDFAREFVGFAAATAEWRTGAGRFPDHRSFTDVRRKGRLRPGRQARRFALDHTAYRLLEVGSRANGRVVLRVRGEPGVAAGIGLVGRDGSKTDGAVRRRTKLLDRRGRASLRLRRARRFERITAVIVNADGSVRGFGRGDWNYRNDRVEFTAAVRGARTSARRSARAPDDRARRG